MRDKARINNILQKIQLIWKNNPDLRFFQLLAMLGYSGGTDYFYLEDDKFENSIDNFLEKISKTVED